MVSENKIAAFLRLQQYVLDIEESTTLLNQFLPKVLEEITIVGYPYIFLSAIFIDNQQNIKNIFFTDKNSQTTGEIIWEKLFQKGSEWEMKVMYGEAAVISDIGYFINSSYPKYQQIKSLLMLPIQHRVQLSGVLVLASSKKADQINREEIEFGEIITRLIDLSFRLQDTESSLIKITQQVYEMNAKLHQLDKLKDDFVSIASHELRTPMTAVRSYAWMALNRSDVPLSEKLKKYLSRTLISTERLINLVNDMLNISRIEAGRVEINPQAFNIAELATDVLSEITPKASEKNISLHLLDSKPPLVFADSDKVHQVLLNLLGNSLKFTPNGGSITVSFFADGKDVDISVKDNGVGITREDLAMLFKKFSKLDNSYVAMATSGGTGLGLYISKSLVELMHGRIWASSDGVGKGSTFTFTLPMATELVLNQAEKYAVRVAGEAKPLEPVAI